MHRKICSMIRPAAFIQKQIPVQKGLHSGIHISNNIMGIPLRVCKRVLDAVFAEFNARLGKQQFFCLEIALGSFAAPQNDPPLYQWNASPAVIVSVSASNIVSARSNARSLL